MDITSILESINEASGGLGQVVLSHQTGVRIPVALPALYSGFPLIFVALIRHRFGDNREVFV